MEKSLLDLITLALWLFALWQWGQVLGYLLLRADLRRPRWRIARAATRPHFSAATLDQAQHVSLALGAMGLTANEATTALQVIGDRLRVRSIHDLVPTLAEVALRGQR